MQRERQRRRGFLDPIAPRPARRNLGLPHMDETAQEGPRRQDHPPGADLGARLRDDPLCTRTRCIYENI